MCLLHFSYLSLTPLYLSFAPLLFPLSTHIYSTKRPANCKYMPVLFPGTKEEGNSKPDIPSSQLAPSSTPDPFPQSLYLSMGLLYQATLRSFCQAPSQAIFSRYRLVCVLRRVALPPSCMLDKSERTAGTALMSAIMGMSLNKRFLLGCDETSLSTLSLSLVLSMYLPRYSHLSTYFPLFVSLLLLLHPHLLLLTSLRLRFLSHSLD